MKGLIKAQKNHEKLLKTNAQLRKAQEKLIGLKNLIKAQEKLEPGHKAQENL